MRLEIPPKEHGHSHGWRCISNSVIGEEGILSNSLTAFCKTGAFYIAQHQSIYIPGTQLTPVLIGRGHILGGWWSNIGVIQVLGIEFSVCLRNYTTNIRPVGKPSWDPGNRFPCSLGFTK